MNDWTRWLAGILFTIVFGAVTTLSANVISNDKDSRNRDDKINEKISDQTQQLNKAVLEQNIHNGKTNVVLERILVKMEEIEKKIAK